MAEIMPFIRKAYIRTWSSIQWSHQHAFERTREDYASFLGEYVRQPNCFGTNPEIVRHQFHFTAFTKDDAHIFQELIESFSPLPRIRWNRSILKDVSVSDMEIHMSKHILRVQMAAKSSHNAGILVLKRAFMAQGTMTVTKNCYEIASTLSTYITLRTMIRPGSGNTRDQEFAKTTCSRIRITTSANTISASKV